MTALEMRLAVRNKYNTILGRNVYSQSKRDYCYKKASDGKYYSDCSSSVCYTYKEVGYGFGIYNTVGLYNQIGKKFTEVPVKISKGQITNPDVLRIGDMLLYRGSDSSRPQAVGHVEMYWGADSKGVRYVVGHGSGNPKKTKLTDKNSSRYNSKASTKYGNKGLFAVIRYINDDGTLGFNKTKATESKPTTTTTQTVAATAKTEPAATIYEGVTVKSGTYNIRSAPDKSAAIVATVKGGQEVQPYDIDEWNFVKIGNISGWIHDSALGD